MCKLNSIIEGSIEISVFEILTDDRISNLETEIIMKAQSMKAMENKDYLTLQIQPHFVSVPQFLLSPKHRPLKQYYEIVGKDYLSLVSSYPYQLI